MWEMCSRLDMIVGCCIFIVFSVKIRLDQLNRFGRSFRRDNEIRRYLVFFVKMIWSSFVSTFFQLKNSSEGKLHSSEQIQVNSTWRITPSKSNVETLFSSFSSFAFCFVIRTIEFVEEINGVLTIDDNSSFIAIRRRIVPKWNNEIRWKLISSGNFLFSAFWINWKKFFPKFLSNNRQMIFFSKRIPIVWQTSNELNISVVDKKFLMFSTRWLTRADRAKWSFPYPRWKLPIECLLYSLLFLQLVQEKHLINQRIDAWWFSVEEKTFDPLLIRHFTFKDQQTIE